MDELFAKAQSIPDLGCGGKANANLLIALAARVSSGVILEIGPWLGSSTAHLALGALNNPYRPAVWSVDRWVADETYHARAKKYHGINLEPGQDLWPLWKQNVKPFGGEVYGIKTDVRELLWAMPIGMLVHDAGDDDDVTTAVLRLGEFMEPLAPLVLLDYGFARERNYGGQPALMQDWGDEFAWVQDMEKPSRAAVFVRTLKGWTR